ncbi:MAG: carbon starvation protein, partial [Pedosphaera sp.]|nr:carbon starvation protein [Pedosphaera sp.]
LPDLKMPAISKFIDGSGLVVAGKLFPFCFITIACGAISGFHTLIASGTTPKMMTRESYTRSIGYGAMCLESLVAIMALIAACTLDPGVYLSMNVKGAGADAAAVATDTIAKVQAAGFTVSAEEMQRLAEEVQEKTLFGRTGGAATLAVGMAQIFSKVTQGRWLGIWYHFAIMFEALFILTTLDAGTRVGRYLVQDLLGNVWKPLGDTKGVLANLLASVLVVAGWGYFLIQGVRDPLGGINSLWPLFGIANQLLAGIGLCLATTILLKMNLKPESTGVRARPVFALVTLLPLVWLLSVTMTAGWQKIFHEDPRIGFLSAAKGLESKLPTLEQAVTAAKAAGEAKLIETAEQAVHTNRVLHFNNMLDAFVAGFFLVMVVGVVLLSVREWILLLARKRLATLRESEPVWLPDYAVAESSPLRAMSLIALGLALAKELSGEAHLERAQELAAKCNCAAERGSVNLLGEKKEACRKTPEQLYVEMTEKRFDGVNRCC